MQHAPSTSMPAHRRNIQCGPAAVVELQRHAGGHQQQEADDHQDVQEAVEGAEAAKYCSPSVVVRSFASEALGVAGEQRQ